MSCVNKRFREQHHLSARRDAGSGYSYGAPALTVLLKAKPAAVRDFLAGTKLRSVCERERQ
jgi:hypothetical protein